MVKTWTFILAFAAVSAFGLGRYAAGEPLSDSARLRKLSLQIRGILPSAVEYAQLEAQSSSQREAFFQAMAQEYLRSGWGAQKISERILEDLRLSISEGLALVRNDRRTSEDLNLTGLTGGGTYEAMWDLVKDQNSWNTIYLTSEIIDLAAQNGVTRYLQTDQDKVDQFSTAAREAGYDPTTSAGVRAVLEAAKTDPERFGLKFKKMKTEALLLFIAGELERVYNVRGITGFVQSRLKEFQKIVTERHSRMDANAGQLKADEWRHVLDPLIPLDTQFRVPLDDPKGLEVYLDSREIDGVGYLPRKWVKSTDLRDLGCAYDEAIIRLVDGRSFLGIKVCPSARLPKISGIRAEREDVIVDVTAILSIADPGKRQAKLAKYVRSHLKGPQSQNPFSRPVKNLAYGRFF